MNNSVPLNVGDRVRVKVHGYPFTPKRAEGILVSTGNHGSAFVDFHEDERVRQLTTNPENVYVAIDDLELVAPGANSLSSVNAKLDELAETITQLSAQLASLSDYVRGGGRV